MAIKYGGVFNRNRLINGSFLVNQKNMSVYIITSTSTTSGWDYTLDMWKCVVAYNASAKVYWNDIALNEFGIPPGRPHKEMQVEITNNGGLTNSIMYVLQNIEEVRNYSDVPVTTSFRAKGTNGLTKVSVEYIQRLGIGGDIIDSIGVAVYDLTTEYQDFVHTAWVPSLGGKTLGTGTTIFEVRFNISSGSDWYSQTKIGLQTGSLHLQRVQTEIANDVSMWEDRDEFLKFLMCQRYYWRGTMNGMAYHRLYAKSARSDCYGGSVTFPIGMRIAAPPAGIIVDPTYSNCTFYGLRCDSDCLMLRVNTTASNSTYMAYNGVFYADANM